MVIAEGAPDEAVHAVFVALTECVDTGEIAKILKTLPHEIRSLWLGYVPHQVAES